MFELIKLNNIQDILLIEEKAKIFRSEVRFIIPRHPTQALRMVDSKIVVLKV